MYSCSLAKFAAVCIEDLYNVCISVYKAVFSPCAMLFDQYSLYALSKASLTVGVFSVIEAMELILTGIAVQTMARLHFDYMH